MWVSGEISVLLVAFVYFYSFLESYGSSGAENFCHYIPFMLSQGKVFPLYCSKNKKNHIVCAFNNIILRMLIDSTLHMYNRRYHL
jgi:hypothetical protein